MLSISLPFLLEVIHSDLRSRSLLVGGDGGASARDQLSHFKSGAWAPPWGSPRRHKRTGRGPRRVEKKIEDHEDLRKS